MSIIEEAKLLMQRRDDQFGQLGDHPMINLYALADTVPALVSEIEKLQAKLNSLCIIYSEHDIDDRECEEVISMTAERLQVGGQIIPCGTEPARFKILAICTSAEELIETMRYMRELE